MKQFTKRVGIFLVLPALLFFMAEQLLPVTFFVNRPWEGVQYSTFIPHEGPFYPGLDLEMMASGDLCFRTEYEVKKQERWITDRLGFRNDSFAESPDVILLGDSFIAGASLSQEELLSNRLAVLTGKSVYNMAPSGFNQFISLIEAGKIRKPACLIFSIVERGVPARLERTVRKDKRIRTFAKELMPDEAWGGFLDRGFRLYSVKWAKARLLQSKGRGMQAETGNKRMFFLQGKFHGHKDEAVDLSATKETILSYKAVCDSLSIRFIFLPMPDKETVYYDFVPLPAQPDYLTRLQALLVAAKINVVPVLDIYNQHRLVDSTLLYRTDDSHWNNNAVNLVAAALAESLLKDSK